MSKPSPFGIHYIPIHKEQADYDFVAAVEPPIVKLVSPNGAPDVQQMADCYKAAPEAVHCYRNHPLSEQHDALWKNPVGTAVHHVSTWQAELRTRRDQAKRRGLVLPPREQTMILGINEPVIELFPREEDMSNYDQWLAMVEHRAGLLDQYMATLVSESVKYGLSCGIGNFSGGQPANRKPGEYATYSWFPLTRRAVERNPRTASLVVHEYWDIQGPRENPDWWTYRFMHCDWDCDVWVLECGVDRAIRTAEYEGTRGYSGHLTGEQYAEQIREYMTDCMADPRFQGATVFTLDGDRIWESFWIDPHKQTMVDMATTLPRMGSASMVDNDDAHDVYLPNVQGGNPKQPQSDQWSRVWPVVLDIEGGLSLDPDDPGNYYNGELVGTKYGISAAQWAHAYDIPNLTKSEALAIYREHYWQASGAHNLSWPMNLVVFDAAVNQGVETARRLFLREPSPEEVYLGQRALLYIQYRKWDTYGVAWGNRLETLREIVAEDV